MTKLLASTLAVLVSATAAGSDWPEPKSPTIPAADGYGAIPDAALRPAKGQTYRAVFDATHAADRPTQLLPAVNMLASELNALGVEGVPLTNARFVLVFHGAALDGILDDEHYKAKFGVSNPNLKVFEELKKAGVELYACGQNLIAEHVDRKTLAPEVRVASDALLVLVYYQNKGYALLSF
jgi:intracellular sulfur oxidation DsrE/DsrF family protein